MQNHEAEIKNEQEISYFASCYISKKYAEILFSVMRVEFVDQLCEREPVIALSLETSPIVVGLAVKAILAESNKKSAKDNPLLSATLSDILQGKIFYSRKDYASHEIGNYAKQDNIGKVYYDTPGYQASKATIIKDFNRYYLNFSVRATHKTIFVNVSFNEWNPIQFSKQVPLDMKNEDLGVLFLGFARLCIQ
jgi:hypothetical protein